MLIFEIGKSLLLGSAAAALEDMLAYTLLLGYLLYLPAADASLAALMALLPMDLTHEGAGWKKLTWLGLVSAFWRVRTLPGFSSRFFSEGP